ncbi:MAG: hypothetical protein AAF636_20890 [Pseudomonadota bacterium]
MKYPLALLTCVWACAPLAVFAQSIDVVAGEHEQFTRFVLRLPEDTQWNLSTERGTATIELDGHEDGFNFNNVFNRIPKLRVENLQQTGNRLIFRLNCMCEVVTFIAEGEFLAIDILDGPQLPEARDDLTVSAGTSVLVRRQLPDSNFSFGDLLWQTEINRAERESDDTIQAAEGSLAPANLSAQQEVIAETRAQLVTGFSMAASRGILQLETDGRLQQKTSPAAEETIIFDPSANTPDVKPPFGSNIRVTTSSDLPSSNSNGHLLTGDQNCLNVHDLDISEWVTDEPYSVQIGKARTDLYDALDSPDLKSIEKLARIYLHFGFGPEAKQILRLKNKDTLSKPALADIADILEYGFVRNPRVLHLGLNCPTDAALWAVLSAQSLPKEQQVKTDAVLRALNGLPFHLRKFLAPKVTERLLEIGETEAADAALRTILRSSGNEDGAEFAMAALEQAKGDENGVERLSRLVASGSQVSPEALIDLVAAKVADKGTVSADKALLLESYVFQLSGGEQSASLVEANIIAAAKSAQFRKSFDLLSEHAGMLETQRRAPAVTSIILDELTRQADDIVFVAVITQSRDMLTPGVEPKAIIEASRRALQLGFFELARNLVKKIPQNSLTSDVGLVQAQIGLSQGNFSDALAQLARLSGHDVDRVRATVNEAAGNHETAKKIHQDLGNEIDARRNAWLASAGDVQNELAGSPFGEALALMTETLPSTAPDTGMLERLGALLNKSEAARTTIDSLMSETDIVN